MQRFPVIAALILAGMSPAARATVYFVGDTTRGWITPSANNGATAGNNYIAGFCPGPTPCTNGTAEFRDFFTFSIPTLDAPVISAVLTLSTGTVSTLDAASMTYQITSIPASPVFADLGAGTIYGSRVYTAVDMDTDESITLDAAGIAAIVSGGTLGIGGRITTLGGSPTSEFVFAATGPALCPACLAQLTITTAPEPATYLLLAAGVAALWFLRRRLLPR